MRKRTWYFDCISPYACLAFHRLRELPVVSQGRQVLCRHLNNPGLFEDPEMARLSTLGKSAERKDVTS